MLLGVIIGICIWQLVIGFAQFFNPDEDMSWMTCPVFCILLATFEWMIAFAAAVPNAKLYFYLWRDCGISPFSKMTISKLTQLLTHEQKQKAVELAKGKYKIALKRLWKM